MNYKNILFILLLVGVGYQAPLKSSSAAQDVTKALVGSAIATFAIDATAHYAGNYHGVFHCPVVVFPAALAAIVSFHRLYAGDWKLLQHLLQLCGVSNNVKTRASAVVSDDFADGFGESDDSSSDDVADSGDCCGGCCSC